MGLDQEPLDQVTVTLRTGNVPGAGTDGEVYLSLGGREFNLKIPNHDDRAPGKLDTYRLGRGANIEHPDRNDPRKILFGSYGFYPVGLRFQPVATTPQPDDWNLADARVVVKLGEGSSEEWVLEEALRNLWLGVRSGLFVALTRPPDESRPEDA
jgi:hypothetical protein